MATAAVSAVTQDESVPAKLWKPRRLIVTRSARDWPLADEIVRRAEVLGASVSLLESNRLPREKIEDPRRAYAQAKGTLVVAVAPPSARKLQPIPPSADWQFHLAQGCPAHCQYCYLAGSLQGAPLTRVYANLPEILGNLQNYLGQGTITSRSAEREKEGTTFECSCYTDPLALEHLTGGLAACIAHFGKWEAPVQLRWTTKFDGVASLLALEHRRRTRVRFSVNAAPVARDFEGGTASVRARLGAMRRMALAGYPVGLTIAPIVDTPGFEVAYEELLSQVRAALEGVPDLDVTAELITHRFTASSKDVLLSWYPKTTLDMAEGNRTEKRTKFGSFKYVYPIVRMKQMRTFLEAKIAEVLPSCRILYWT